MFLSSLGVAEYERSSFLQTHKIGNVGIIANFVLP